MNNLRAITPFKTYKNSIPEILNEPTDTFGTNSKHIELYNQKYFRPSCLEVFNTRNLNDLIFEIHSNDPAAVLVPETLFNTPINTIINYYSVLREATTIPEGGAGCGTIGMQALPYPIAYNFLSKNYQKQLSYEQYLKSFRNTSHINLIKLIKKNNIPASPKNTLTRHFIELELIEPSGTFTYAFGYIDVIKENSLFKINNIQLMHEDFFCAPYHKWEHNAENRVDIMYGNWCKLIAQKYPTVESNYTKKIYISGTDQNDYLFIFVKLTNGTDVEIGQYKKTASGQWIPVIINPYACLQRQ